MATTKQLSILNGDVDGWNAWRTAGSERPQLMGVAIGDLNLSRVDFSNTDLRRASFRDTNLTQANFRGANLLGATFLGCFLSGSKFSDDKFDGPTIADYCNFTGSNLSYADLSGAGFESADFQGTVLSYAKLRNANLTRANFRNVRAAPVFTSTDVMNRVRNYFGSDIPDLSDSDLENLRNLCVVFTTVFPDESEMLRTRSEAFGRTELQEIDKNKLQHIFHLDAKGSDDDVELILQLLHDFDSMNGADFFGANLTEANLSGANLTRADFRSAHLNKAVLVGTDLSHANLCGASVYGISAWDVNLEGTMQRDLSINPLSTESEPGLTVDNIEVAQFIYLLLNNEKIRDVIDTITSKVVLILGRFTPNRKSVLDAMRDELRKRDYLPVLFDFEKPTSKDLTGTVLTLANMARFIIADLTEPSSLPHELAMIVPSTVVPVQPILVEGQEEYAMFPDLQMRYHWVLEPYQYQSKELLLAHLGEKVIAPAETKAKALARK